MNSGRAKKLARIVYGDFSRREVKYFRSETGQITRDDRRRRYQVVKKNYSPLK